MSKEEKKAAKKTAKKATAKKAAAKKTTAKKATAKKATAKKAVEKKVTAKAAAPKAEAKPVAKEATKKAAAKPQKSGGTVTVEQIGSPIRQPKKQRATLKGLGLTRMHQRRTLEDTPSVRGMINKIGHLVRVVDEAS